MKKKDIYTLLLLIVLTIVSAIVSLYLNDFNYFTTLILALSLIKFVLISFQFMELKRANLAWKVALIGYLFIFGIIITIMTY